MLVVALHVIGATAESGLHLPMTSAWHYGMESIEFLRMPLFTALSGYLYAGNRVTRPMFQAFWRKKLRRLGIPLICVTIVVWFLREHAYGDSTTLAHDLVFAHGHLWYIQALIILFIGISIADSLLRPGFCTLVIVGLAMIMLTQSGVDLPTVFSLKGAIYLTPYFLFGILLREQAEWLRDRRAGTLALGMVIIILFAQQSGLYGLTEGVTQLQLPAAVAGMSFVVFLLQRMPRNRLLALIGGYSYTIYLWHIVANAAVRGALMKAGITSLPLLFAVCFLVAITTPILLYHTARLIPFMSVAVTGEKASRALRRNDRSNAISTTNRPLPTHLVALRRVLAP